MRPPRAVLCCVDRGTGQLSSASSSSARVPSAHCLHQHRQDSQNHHKVPTANANIYGVISPIPPHPTPPHPTPPHPTPPQICSGGGTEARDRQERRDGSITVPATARSTTHHRLPKPHCLWPTGRPPKSYVGVCHRGGAHSPLPSSHHHPFEMMLAQGCVANCATFSQSQRRNITTRIPCIILTLCHFHFLQQAKKLGLCEVGDHVVVSQCPSAHDRGVIKVIILDHLSPYMVVPTLVEVSQTHEAVLHWFGLQLGMCAT